MKIFWLILRLGFGALFIWSGIAKLKDPISFAEDVRNFRIIGDPIAPAMALLIPWVEIVAGIAVMAGKWARGGAFVLVGALVMFTGAVILGWVRGLDITCGCFGGNEELNYPVKVAENIGLLIWGMAIWFRAEMDEVSTAPSSSEPVEA